MSINASSPAQLQIDIWRSLLTLLTIAALAFGLLALAPTDAPLTELEIRGSFERLQADDVRRAAGPMIAQSFFAADISAIHDAVAALPWVSRVQVERKWPGRIVLQIWERRALARWNEHSALDEQAVSFTPRAAEIPTGLPQLSGRRGHETEVLHAWRRVSAALEGTPLELSSLQLNSRGQWSARTQDHAIELRFGQAPPDERLAALQGAGQRALEGRWHQVEYIDLRYTNGFAVAWRKAEADSGSVK